MVEPIRYGGGMVHLWGRWAGWWGVWHVCAVYGIVCVAGESAVVDRQ